MKFTKSSLLALLLAAVILTSLLCVLVRANNNNNDDDDVIDISDNEAENERARRSRFNPAGAESDMVYDDFQDEARQRERKSQKQQQQGDGGNKQKKSKEERERERKEREKAYEREYQKQKEQQRKSHQGSSSSSRKPKTLTEQLHNVIQSLEDVRASYAATSNHLTRLNFNKHFNTTVNSPAGLQVLSTLVPSLGAETIIDGDALEHASSTLATARYEVYSLRQKVEKHAAAAGAGGAAKKSSSEDPKINAPGSEYPSKDLKLQGLRNNLKTADQLMASLVATETRQRTIHKRLLRAAKLASPTALKFVRDVVEAADDRLVEMRGVKSGEVDSAAPAGDVRVGRLERRKFQTVVKKLKMAYSNLEGFVKLSDSQLRRGKGLTKSMQAWFVFTQLVARDGLSDDVLEVLAATDGPTNTNNNNDSDNNSDDAAAAPGGELAKFLLAQNGMYHQQQVVGSSTETAAFALAKRVSTIAPTSPTGFAFGLQVGEFLALVVMLVAPVQLFHIVYLVVINKIVPLILKSKSNSRIINNNNRRKKNFSGPGRKLGGSSPSSAEEGNKTKQRQQKNKTPLFLVVIIIAVQLCLMFVLVDLPVIDDYIEDFPVTLGKRPDVTLPTVLWAALRLQVSVRPQLTLAFTLMCIAGAQALMVAKTVAENQEAEGDSDDEYED